VFAACHRDEIPEIVPSGRTIIIYMAADNDLSADAYDDIEEMKEGFSEVGTNLIVFFDSQDELPCILKIKPNSTDEIRTYQEFNSANASQVRQVLNDIIDMYPAENYGLVLWSHGTSWLPANIQLKSFGEDHGTKMNIPDLAEALPVHFDFILFDACLMGSVEVAYELRNKTDYLIASSTETIYKGFPYDEIIPELIKSSINYPAVAQKYFDFYNNMDGAYRSATISLIDTKELGNLANETAKLISANEISVDFDRTNAQRLDIYEEQYTFDFADFINKAFPEANKSAFQAQLNKTVLYKAHTPTFLEEYQIDVYCGLSSYIPVSGRTDLNDYYKTLQWFNAGSYEKFFNLSNTQ
jgi:hypothetical protein